MPTISFFGLIGKNNELITDSRRTCNFFRNRPSQVGAMVNNSLFIEITLSILIKPLFVSNKFCLEIACLEILKFVTHVRHCNKN